jgi:hypothetical protein
LLSVNKPCPLDRYRSPARLYYEVGIAEINLIFAVTYTDILTNQDEPA